MFGLLMMLAAGPGFTLTQAEANLISRDCRTPVRWIKINDDKSIHFKPSPKAAYTKVDCVLSVFRKRAGPIAFVGSMTPD